MHTVQYSTYSILYSMYYTTLHDWPGNQNLKQVFHDCWKPIFIPCKIQLTDNKVMYPAKCIRMQAYQISSRYQSFCSSDEGEMSHWFKPLASGTTTPALSYINSKEISQKRFRKILLPSQCDTLLQSYFSLPLEPSPTGSWHLWVMVNNDDFDGLGNLGNKCIL